MTAEFTNNSVKRIGALIGTNFLSGFLEPLRLSPVLNLRLSFLLFAGFSHRASQW